MVDDVVEGCAGKVSQQYLLTVGTRFQPVDKIAQGVVAIVLEAGSYG